MAFPSKLPAQLPESCHDFPRQFFSKCPAQTAALLFKAEYPAGYSPVTTDDSCASVFFLLKGRLQAIEERLLCPDFEPADFGHEGGGSDLFRTRENLYKCRTGGPSSCMKNRACPTQPAAPQF